MELKVMLTAGVGFTSMIISRIHYMELKVVRRGEIVEAGSLEVTLELWVGFIGWWTGRDLNPGPPPCEGTGI